MQTFDLAVRTRLGDALEIREDDLDRALAALKRDLTLRTVRRHLLSDGLDGRTARALADLAVSLQE